MNIALILAGGLGLRMNQSADLPKQFFVLGEKPVIVHTLDKFQQHPEVDAICVVCLPTWEGYFSDLIKKFGISKVRWVIEGGDLRQQSVYNGLLKLEQECSDDDMVIVHDGVRPFITQEVITENIKVAREHGNAMTSMRSTDTLITSHDCISSSSAMDRDSTFTVQTPQTYQLGSGLRLYRKAYELGRKNTINCCEMFIELGEPIYIVRGLKTNLKLTTSDDIAYLKALHLIFHDQDGSDDLESVNLSYEKLDL